MREQRLTGAGNQLCDAAGFTLAEALVSASLLVMVVTVVASLLFGLLRSHQWFLKQTDQFESLRIAAAYIRQDGRFATVCDFNWSYLKLYGANESDYVEYTTLPNGEGSYDLHRTVYQGGVSQSDDIVGWDVLPAIFTTDPARKTFACVGASPSARVRLQKRALPGQTGRQTFELFSFQRGG